MNIDSITVPQCIHASYLFFTPSLYSTAVCYNVHGCMFIFMFGFDHFE